MSTSFRMHSKHNNPDEWLCMSNGGTAVFLSVLVLSGSRLAQEKKEKELIIWISEHDDTVRGRGCNGFDIEDIPWDFNNFERERSFILKVIEGAREKLGWETLHYEPNEAFVFSYLDTFKNLIINFDPVYIDKEAYRCWKEEGNDPRFAIPEGFTKCPKHGTLLYFNGCIACNDC
ncbi:hypothetical protein [Acetivibrio clariflavus]|uniref:Uncharacterized protein n=2 Tax=Acetivibrio clariflavus TaxID=288965 RepID=G8LY02_ACECE|nr:hypothetical protein [Acetivibrio clariflavus]AEV69934.1 hypothetical protein Clocl_3438 [Acetivibrio clariflavus DSM 19732]NLM57806.1 hypothetical protein [Clostridium sp.]